jgi:triosephosphate isomerase
VISHVLLQEEFGSVGVLLASGIVKAPNPKAALEDLVIKV